MPGAACLSCRGRISGDVIAAEILQETNPSEYESQRKQGYIPELGTQAPAVIPFTSAIASFSINELLHRLSGYMGDDRVSTELFLLFDDSRNSRNSTPASPECVCSKRKKWGRGDTDPFLGLHGVAKNDQRLESLPRTKGPSPLPAQALLRAAHGGARQRYSRSHEGTHLRRSAFRCSPMGGLRVSLLYRAQNYREPAEARPSSLDCHEVGPRCLFASVVMVS
jgi:hypothetical protein